MAVPSTHKAVMAVTQNAVMAQLPKVLPREVGEVASARFWLMTEGLPHDPSGSLEHLEAATSPALARGGQRRLVSVARVAR